MRIHVPRPSPALVISCIALTVALGGTSYATVLNVPKGSVGTPQLKNSAVTSLKVKNRSLLRVDFAPGQLAAGPAGPAGPAGAAGPAGPPGLSGVERVEVTSVSNSGSSKSGAMACPAGKRLLGGGARLNPALPQVALQSSHPDNDNVYRATAREVVATGSSWSLTVFAICATAS
ncbi:MAG TPA: hypothetical protein VFO56_00025 [Gaiellaceae bacterium]|nr:hypothetical protein [Gaiellaceae bacterium]